MADSIPTKMIPLRWVVKFDPAQIGLVYKINEKDKKKRIYLIDLNELIEMEESLEIAEQLFKEHPLFLNKSILQVEQVANLVEIIQDQMQLGNRSDKFSNSQSNSQKVHLQQGFNQEQGGFEDISDYNE